MAWSGELGYGVRAPEADQATKDSMADPHPVVGQDGGVLHDRSATSLDHGSVATPADAVVDPAPPTGSGEH